MTDIDHTAVNAHPFGKLIRLTVYGPLLDLRCVDLQCGRDRRVWEIPPNVVRCKRGKGEQANFAFEL